VRQCECKKRRIAQGRIAGILKRWPKYANATIETFKPRNAGQQNAIKILREKPTGSYFFGGYYQRGKTHLLVAQYRWMADRGMRCILMSAQELMADLKKAETATDEHPYRSPVLEMVNDAESGHLFIDDIEKASAKSDFRAEALFSLFDMISRRNLGLSLTSNFPIFAKENEEDKEDLRKLLTDEVALRIRLICKVVDV
jgi:DNA replication protein DnaC